MQKLLIGIVAIIGLAGGLFWSGSGWSRGTPAGPLKEIVIERSSDGHFYADALVNGHSIRFLVDTGAGTVALSEEDATAAGIKVNPSNYRAIGEAPSGLVRGEFVDLKRVAVGDFAPAEVQAAVVQGASVSLLGQPFLDQLDEVVIRRDVMILRYS